MASYRLLSGALSLIFSVIPSIWRPIVCYMASFRLLSGAFSLLFGVMPSIWRPIFCYMAFYRLLFGVLPSIWCSVVYLASCRLLYGILSSAERRPFIVLVIHLVMFIHLPRGSSSFLAVQALVWLFSRV